MHPHTEEIISRVDTEPLRRFVGHIQSSVHYRLLQACDKIAAAVFAVFDCYLVADSDTELLRNGASYDHFVVPSHYIAFI